MREPGYYWISWIDDWSIAFWNGSYWSYVNTENQYYDDDFEEIDERKIERL